MAKFELPFHKKRDGAVDTAPTTTKTRTNRPAGGMKSHGLAIVPEFVGTVLFLWFAFAIQQMAIDQTGILSADTNVTNGGSLSAQTIIIIALGWGFSYAVVIWTLYRVADGFFNPAVTLGLVLAGALNPIRGVLLVIAQFVGAMVAAGLVAAMFPGDIGVVNTYKAANTNIPRALFIEMFLTMLLVTTILMLVTDRHTRSDSTGRDDRHDLVAGPGYRHDAVNAPRRDGVTAPIGIGLALFIANLAGLFYTGASLNPARSFGPCVADRSFPGYHWIYWLGPLLGAVIAAAYYRFVRMFHQEEGYAAPDFGSRGHGHGVAGGHTETYDGTHHNNHHNNDMTTAPGYGAGQTTAPGYGAGQTTAQQGTVYAQPVGTASHV